jgi:3-oxoacyl-[acyl-carrier protein] reductase
VELGLTDRAALVSGGSRGIGRATARALAMAGARVVIVARSPAEVEQAASALSDETATVVHGVTADMTDDAQVRRVVGDAVRAVGALDIAVSNVIGHVIEAGSPGPHPCHFVDTSADDVRAELRQLAFSAWSLASAVLPGMVERGWGRIVNVGSRVAREPNPDIPHALPNMVRPIVAGLHAALARHVAGTGVTVNSVLTGSITTERNRAYHTWLAAQWGTTYEEVIRRRTSTVPVRRMGSPEELATLIAFLCSVPARAINGQSIPVDGGISRFLW